MNSNRKIFRNVFIIVSLILSGIWGFLLIYEPTGPQHNLFFYQDSDFFMDFFNVVYWSFDRTPYTWGLSDCHNYLPLSYLLLYPFSVFYDYEMVNDTISHTSYDARYSQMPALSCALFLIVSCSVVFYSLYKAYKGAEHERLLTLIALFFSSIVLYNVERANELILASGLLFLYIITYDSNNKLLRHFGYICLAVSATLKLIPALFGILILFKRRYKEAAITIVYALCFMFLPFFVLKGGFVFNFKLFLEGIKIHQEAYATSGTLGFNHATIFWNDYNYNMILPGVLLVLALISSYYIDKEWKQILVLSLGMLLFTGQPSYYYIIFLLLPFVMFLNDENLQIKDLFWLISFIIIWTPLQYDRVIGPLHFHPRLVANTLLIMMYLTLIVQGLRTAYLSIQKNKQV